MKITKIVVATRNKGKIKEIDEIMQGMGIEFVTQDDIGIDVDVEENGTSFEENSFIKAEAISNLCDYPVIADDSGLEVDYLNGEPGIYSARYAGENASDDEKINKLLTNMKNCPTEKRTARFVCAATLVFKDGKKISVRGECEGVILTEPKGRGGFGYDPVFYVPEYNATFGEIPLSEKNKISHRAIAFKKIRQEIKKYQ